MRRRIVLALTMVVVVGAVAGCGAQDPVESPDAVPPEEPLGGVAATTVIWAENMGDSAAYDSSSAGTQQRTPEPALTAFSRNQ
jgi:predicted small lipoprotein YifL